MLFEGPLTELQRHSKGALTLRLLHPAKALPVLQANGLPTAAVGEDNTIALPPRLPWSWGTARSIWPMLPCTAPTA